MKRIFLMDPLSPWGHKDINEVTIDILHGSYEIVYCGAKDFVEKKYADVTYIEMDREYFEITGSSVNNRIRLIKVLKKMLNLACRENPDYIYLMSYDTIVTAFVMCAFRFKYKKLFQKIFLLNHSNADEILGNKIKKAAFQMIPSAVTNVFYEKYIGEKIQAYTKKSYKVIHHNINDYKMLCGKKEHVRKELLDFFGAEECLYVVSPSSNEIDMSFFDEIMEMDKTGVLSENKIKFFIKDKRVEYCSEHVYFFHEFLSDDEYSYVLKEASFVLLLYNEKTYRYRVSGVYFDAVTFQKPIIYSNNLFFEDQRRRFHDIGVLLDGSVFKCIEEIQKCNYSLYQMQMEAIREAYSGKELLKEFKEVLRDESVIY